MENLGERMQGQRQPGDRAGSVEHLQSGGGLHDSAGGKEGATEEHACCAHTGHCGARELVAGGRAEGRSWGPTAVAGAVRRGAERFLPANVVNFWCHVVEGAFATIGTELVSAAVVFPVLAAALGATPSTLGLLTSLGGLAVLAPLFAAPRVEAVRRKKRLVVFLGIGMRLPLLFIAICLVVVAESAPLACLVAIAFLKLAMAASSSVLVPPWIDVVAETIPANRVGRLFGYRSAISSGLGVFSGLACGAILVAFAFPGNYALLYLASFGSMAVSWLVFALVDEIPGGVAPKERSPAGSYFRDLLATLRDDTNYRRYLIHKGVSRMGLAAMPFYALVAVRYHGVSQAFAAGAFIASASVAKIAGSLTFPFLGERIGHRRLLGLGTCIHAAAAILAASAPSGIWFVGVFFLVGLGTGCRSVASMPFIMSVAPRGRRVGYTTLSMAAMTPVGMIAAPGAGFAMQAFGHEAVFAFAAAVIVASLLPLGRCRVVRTPGGPDRPGSPPPLPTEGEATGAGNSPAAANGKRG